MVEPINAVGSDTSEIMGHQKQGNMASHGKQFGHHIVSCGIVKGAGHFIENQQGGFPVERPSDAQALTLTTR